MVKMINYDTIQRRSGTTRNPQTAKDQKIQIIGKESIENPMHRPIGSGSVRNDEWGEAVE